MSLKKNLKFVCVHCNWAFQSKCRGHYQWHFGSSLNKDDTDGICSHCWGNKWPGWHICKHGEIGKIMFWARECQAAPIWRQHLFSVYSFSTWPNIWLFINEFINLLRIVSFSNCFSFHCVILIFIMEPNPTFLNSGECTESEFFLLDSFVVSIYMAC
jgi:hypothetical protein